MAAQFLPYLIMFIGAFIVFLASNTIINLVWTLLMTSYSLSLPGLLWNGGQFGFPNFVPSPQSPMMFYYWFFVIAIIIIVICFALNAFRHLAVWGKFDETQAYEQTNFWHQFKWVIILIFMTLLTPILIWMVYSLMMLGVFFLMTLIGKNVMFESVTEPEFNALKEAVSGKVDQLMNVLNNPKEFCDALKDLANKLQEVNSTTGNTYAIDYFLTLGYNLKDATLQASNLITNLNKLSNIDEFNSAFASIKEALKNIQEAMPGIRYDKPLDTTLIQSFQTAVATWNMDIGSAIIDPETTSITLDYANAWTCIFGPARSQGAFNFYDLCMCVKPEVGSSIMKIAEEWANPSGTIFEAIGYGDGGQSSVLTEGSLMSQLGGIDSIKVTTITESGDTKITTFNIMVLSYTNGYATEGGLNVCPLSHFLYSILSIRALPDRGSYYAAKTTVLVQLLGAVSGMLLNTLGQKLRDTGIGIPFYGVGLQAAGYILMTAGVFLILSCGLVLLINMLIWFEAFKIMVMPLIGIVIYLWKSLFEAMWHFFLLLPAIGASVVDNGREIYKRQWKQVAGKTAVTLVVWCGILLMFTALFQVDRVYSMIINAVKQQNPAFSETLIISIPLPTSMFKGLLEVLKSIAIVVQINLGAIVKFIIVAAIISASCTIMQKIGVFAFGDEVFGDMNNAFANPLTAISPAFANSARKLGGVASGAMNQVANRVGSKAAAKYDAGAKMRKNRHADAVKNKDKNRADYTAKKDLKKAEKNLVKSGKTLDKAAGDISKAEGGVSNAKNELDAAKVNQTNAEVAKKTATAELDKARVANHEAQGKASNAFSNQVKTANEANIAHAELDNAIRKGAPAEEIKQLQQKADNADKAADLAEKQYKSAAKEAKKTQHAEDVATKKQVKANANLASAINKVATANSNVTTAESALDSAKTEYNRLSTPVSDGELKTYSDKLDTANASVESATKELERLSGIYKKAEKNGASERTLANMKKEIAVAKENVSSAYDGLNSAQKDYDSKKEVYDLQHNMVNAAAVHQNAINTYGETQEATKEFREKWGTFFHSGTANSKEAINAAAEQRYNDMINQQTLMDQLGGWKSNHGSGGTSGGASGGNVPPK